MDKSPHTVVTLSNAVLYPPTFSKVRDLSPVFIGVRGAGEGRACSVRRVLPGCWSSSVGVLMLGHGVHWGRHERPPGSLLSRCGDNYRGNGSEGEGGEGGDGGVGGVSDSDG